MSTRRKAGKVRKSQAAPRKQAGSRPATSRARASNSGRRVAAESPSGKAVKRRASAAIEVAPPAFAADCTIAQADDMKAGLLGMLEKPACVTLDLSPIRRIDTAAIQVLTAFIRERRAAGRAVECKGASDALLMTARILGLSALFAPVTDDGSMAPAGHA